LVRIAELGEEALGARLRAEGLTIDFGAAQARILTDLPALCASLRRVYGHFPIQPSRGLFDVTARVRRARGIRRFIRPQIELVVDGRVPFEPFAVANDLPLLEWGLNWCLAERCNTHLLLHAGVVERADAGVILPALPGSGKSTLTAALAVSGFRLLSDEFGVVRLDDGRCVPMLRPIALKNESIGVVARLRPDVILGPVFAGTRKGDVAHLGPDAESVDQRHIPAMARFIVFPQFQAGAATELEPIARARAFAKLAVNSFNYEVLGPAAFEVAGRLIARCECYRLRYGDLAEAIAAIEALLPRSAGRRGAESREAGGLAAV
jgi:HprK-related kinase A